MKSKDKGRFKYEKKENQESSSKYECYGCGERGHLKADCPNQKKNEEIKEKKFFKKKKAYIAWDDDNETISDSSESDEEANICLVADDDAGSQVSTSSDSDNYSEYSENFASNADGIAGLTLIDNRKITGTGVDLKFGAIFRPIEDSPFRIGLSVATPTWYDLTTSNTTSLTDGKTSANIGESYDFKVYTPWKFGVSLGHTVGDYLALGASYEYADYGSMDTRINDGDGYYDDWYGEYYESSSSDDAMNDNTKKVLKGVSTLKLGLEYKPMPEFAIRLGYNYVSPMFDKEGYKDGTISSAGSYYASQTDYTNWKATNRLTCGFGYAIGQLNLDIAYQYSSTNGDFHPFMNYYESNTASAEDNEASAVKVSNKRHQLLFTVGYRF